MATKTWSCTADAIGAYDGSSSYGGDCDHLPAGYMSWLGGPARAFLKFALDWSGVVQIQSATLYVKTSTGYHGSIGSSNTCYVDLVTGSWGEGPHPGETWYLNDPPAYNTAVDTSYRASFTARSTNTVYSVDITSIVNRWAPSSVKQSNGSPGPGQANNGIRIVANNESSASYRTEFWSREGGFTSYIVLTYSTNTPPNAPTLTSPSSGTITTSQTPALSFSASDPDSGDTINTYDLQIATDSGFANLVANVAGAAVPSPAQSVSVTYTPSALARNTTYYWRARVYDASGAASPWSSTSSFVVAALPTVSGLAPTSGGYAPIHNLSEAAIWADGSPAKPQFAWTYGHATNLAMASYRVRVYDASSGGNLVADTGTVTKSASPGTTVYANLGTGMPRGTARWWTVEVTDSVGGSSGESARQQFSVQWGQALYEAAAGTTTSSWSFSVGAVTGGSVAFLFRTASQSGAGGSFGTTSAWTTNIANLDPAAYLNVLVRLAPSTPGTNVTLADMTFSYIGAASLPDNWNFTIASGDTVSLSTAERRFGTKSLKYSRSSSSSGYRNLWQEVPVVPGTTYTLSAYVKTPVPLTGGNLRLLVWRGGTMDWIQQGAVLKWTEITTDTTGYPDGWQRLTETIVVPLGWTSLRVGISYAEVAANVAEVFYVDGVKLEEGPVATPWQAGAIGSVLLDSGGIAVDGTAGGAFRLRAADGTTFALGSSGLIGGGVSRPVVYQADGPLWGAQAMTSPSAGTVRLSSGNLEIGQPATAGQSGVVARDGGNLELTANAGVPYIDFKTDATVDFNARLQLASDNLFHLTGRDLTIDTGNLRLGADVSLSRSAANVLRLGAGSRLDADAVGRIISRSTAISVPANTWTAVTGMTDVRVGLGTTLNAYGNGEIRVDVPGWYCIVGVGAFAGSTSGNRRIIACAFGSYAAPPTTPNPIDARTHFTGGAGLDVYMQAVYLVYLAAGATIGLRVHQNSSGNLNLTTASLAVTRLGV